MQDILLTPDGFVKARKGYESNRSLFVFQRVLRTLSKQTLWMRFPFHRTPKPCFDILVISPPVLKPGYYEPGNYNYPEAVTYSKALAQPYEKMCVEEKIHFLDSAPDVQVGEEDESHVHSDSHSRLAEAMWKKIQIIWDKSEDQANRS